MLVMVLVFGMTVIGCDDDSTDNKVVKKVIDPKFRGKWEVQSFEYNGTIYTLPYTGNSATVTSMGYEIDESSVTTYANGSIQKVVAGVYSEGNKFYNSNGQYGNLTIQITGNNAAFVLRNETDNCIKVSKFSWE